MRLEIAGRQIVGSKEPQQDSWRVFNPRGEDISNNARSAVATGDGTLVVVADGIGGYAGGEVASRLACDAFGSAFFHTEGAIADRLAKALDAANAAIAEGKRRQPDLQDMGCTLIGVYFCQGRMTFVSVGDSLLLRSRDDEIHRVNIDHSYFDYLDRQVLGSNDPQRWSMAMRDTRRRASLTLAVTGGNLNSAEYGHKPQIAVRPLLPDDVIIVASDGLETLDWVQLQNFMLHLRPSGVAGIGDGLIGAVDGIGQTRSYQDNTTIVLIGASGGAGVTKVQLASRKAEAAPSLPGPESESLLSRLPALSGNPAVLAGIGLFGVLLLVLLLFFAPSLTDSWRSVSPGPTVPTQVNDKPSGQKASESGPAPSNDSASVDGPADKKTRRRLPLSAKPQPDNASSDRPADPQVTVAPPGTAVPAGTAAPDGVPVNAPVAGPPATQESARPVKVDWNVLKGSYLKGRLSKPPQPKPSSANACQAACDKDSACIAYNWWFDGRCELFAGVIEGVTDPDDPKVQMGVKQRIEGRQGSRLDSLIKLDRNPKLDPAINAINANKCLISCLGRQDCLAYTLHGGDNNCELFSSVSKRTGEPDARSWFKDPSPTADAQ
jgi:PPM family protein phosphatase